MLGMARRKIIPAVEAYVGDVASAYNSKKATGLPLSCASEEHILPRLSELVDEMDAAAADLEAAVEKAAGIEDSLASARSYHDEVIPIMDRLRAASDAAERIVGEERWPLPTYSQMLFYV